MGKDPKVREENYLRVFKIRHEERKRREVGNNARTPF